MPSCSLQQKFPPQDIFSTQLPTTLALYEFFTHHASCTLQVQQHGRWQPPNQTSWSSCWASWWRRETCFIRWEACFWQNWTDAACSTTLYEVLSEPCCCLKPWQVKATADSVPCVANCLVLVSGVGEGGLIAQICNEAEAKPSLSAFWIWASTSFPLWKHQKPSVLQRFRVLMSLHQIWQHCHYLAGSLLRNKATR